SIPATPTTSWHQEARSSPSHQPADLARRARTHPKVNTPPPPAAVSRRPHSLVARDVTFFFGRGRRVGTGPGVAWPKSRCSGCNPAALATESFPWCPPGPCSLLAAARAASDFRRLQVASLTWRL